LFISFFAFHSPLFDNCFSWFFSFPLHLAIQIYVPPVVILRSASTLWYTPVIPSLFYLLFNFLTINK
jgi:hypothetical protein